MKRAENNEVESSVATLPPTLRQRRWAFAVVIATLAAFGAVTPFASLPLERFDSFTPAMAAIIFVSDLVTAVLLFGQFSATGSRALLVLASGYLFSSLIAIPFALTFPGAFAPTGLLGAGPQSAAWLSISIRLGSAVATIGYALLRPGKHTKASIEPSPRLAILWGVAIIIVVVSTVTWAVTTGHDLLPTVLSGGTIVPAGYYANAMTALMNGTALLLLWSRGRSVLDLWLMVAASAQLTETALVALLLPTRFSLFFYATRVITLLVSKVVLIVLLTELIMLQARLTSANRRLQRERENKLTAAGAVVAAIAHEVGQPLAAVTINAAVGRRFLDRASPNIAEAKNLFDEIAHAGSLANEVFDNFLSLLRGGTKEHEPLDMNALVLEAIDLLRNQLRDHNIVVDTMLASDLPTIQGNRGHLREVILNLAQNAVEAMSATTGPRILSVMTSRRTGGSILISLQDTGPGIDPDTLSVIFIPFVTTKAEGTGLGLPISQMIVQQHGGDLSAASDMHDGARFEITLPTSSDFSGYWQRRRAVS